MDDSRLKDWIRYVQEQSKNVPGAQQEPPNSRVPHHTNDRPARSIARPVPKPVAKPAKPEEQSGEFADVPAVEEVPSATAIAHRQPASARTRSKDPSAKIPNATAKQRVRLRPETRAQMLDRLTNPTISLHEASVILDVCPATVRRYTNLGLLPHERTSGGQRRFRLRTVLGLLREIDTKRHAEKIK